MKLRIGLAQLNPTVGDIEGNARAAARAVRDAKAAGLHLLALPEMFLTGYPTNDLLFEEGFVEANIRALEEIVAPETEGIAVIIGCVERCAPGRANYDGPDMHNCAAILSGGKRVRSVKKTLLPNYDVFDEKRYFAPGAEDEIAPVEIEIGGKTWKVGVEICEDLWDDRYDTKVTSLLVQRGAEFIVNISASPFYAGKGPEREALARRRFSDNPVPFFYVNMSGGQDELVYDGQSFALDRDGRTVARAKAFEEQILEVEFGGEAEARGPELPPAGMPWEEQIIRAHVLNLRDYYSKLGIFKGIVVGLSGGLDSAYTAHIAAEAVGAENVLCVAMPSEFSSAHSLTDAEALARNIGARYIVAPIKEMYEAGLKTFEDAFGATEFGLAEENDQPRCRMIILMKISMKFGYMVCTTGNKSELSTGYFTMFGDGAGGKNVPGDVYKTEMYSIARFINREKEIIPWNTIEKPPSAELKPDQKDTDSLPPYEVLDAILRLLVEERLSMREIIARGHDAETVKKVFQLYKRSEFKRDQLPRGIKISKKAFGAGRRMPITNKW